MEEGSRVLDIPAIHPFSFQFPMLVWGPVWGGHCMSPPPAGGLPSLGSKHLRVALARKREQRDAWEGEWEPTQHSFGGM